MTRQQIYDYIKEKYDIEPINLWKSYPSYAVFRHKSSNKWFGIIMDVPKERLGLYGTGEINILNVKNTPEKVDLLRQAQGFLPAYHMNKTHWISIILEGPVSDKVIRGLLDESYQLTKK